MDNERTILSVQTSSWVAGPILIASSATSAHRQGIRQRGKVI